MNVNKSTRRRLIVGTGATVLAATALSLVAATGAQAATGAFNGGVRNIRVTPTAPATDFGVPGTAGVVTINVGDGRAAVTSAINQGDANRHFIQLPQGLAFAPNACASFSPSDSTWTRTCTLTNGNRDLNWGMRAATTGISGVWDQNSDRSFPILSTGGPITGQVYAQYDQFGGLSNFAPTTTLAASLIPYVAPVAPAPAKLTDLNAVGPTNGQFDLTGKGEPGAAIKVVDANGNIVTGTVGSDGNWLVKVPQTGTTPPLTITESVNGSVVDTVTFDKEPLPVLNPAVAGGILGLAGIGLAGTILVRRRKQSAATAAA